MRDGNYPVLRWETYLHQVPGGMISNLGPQLRQVGKEAQLQQALEETSRVRVEFGYPDEVCAVATRTCEQVVAAIRAGAEPYDTVWRRWLESAAG